MKHPATRQLFDYWTQRRGLRAAPDRADIDPGRLKALLPDTFVLSFDAAAGHPFRIAGTRLCALFCRELKGAAFVDLWDEPGRVRALLDIGAHEAVGLVAGAHATVDGKRLELELLALPLGLDGRMPARFIGVLTPLSDPYWIGVRPLARLTLGMHRHLGRALVGRPRLQLMAGTQASRLRSGFLVLDGGRSGAREPTRMQERGADARGENATAPRPGGRD